MNVPARWGQSPFTNITLDITVPEDLQNQVPTYDDHHLFKDIDDRDLLKKAQERDSAIQTLEELTYTNSSQVLADHTDDPFEALDLQNNLQCKYTGGTVMHLYMGEKLPSAESCKRSVKKVIENYQMPYITVTPVFSICETHGYLNGEQPECPTCGEATNVWTRVMGYFRPVSSFNKGKKGEHLERQHFLDHHLESGGRIEDA